MGLFSDMVGPNRDNWRFTYTGKELLPFANQKLASLRVEAGSAWRRMRDLTASKPDADFEDRGKEIDKARRQYQDFGSQAERCAVLAHEFARKPEREYTLGIGDVTYLDVVMLSLD
jgi:hypothetical protein